MEQAKEGFAEEVMTELSFEEEGRILAEPESEEGIPQKANCRAGVLDA